MDILDCLRAYSDARTTDRTDYRMALDAAAEIERLRGALTEAQHQRDTLQAALLELMRIVAKFDPRGVTQWLRENKGSAEPAKEPR